MTRGLQKYSAIEKEFLLYNDVMFVKNYVIFIKNIFTLLIDLKLQEPIVNKLNLISSQQNGKKLYF